MTGTVVRELPAEGTQTMPQLQLLGFLLIPRLLQEHFHIIPVPSLACLLGAAHWRPGPVGSLAPSTTACWPVSFTPFQRAVFLSIPHRLLHFFEFLVAIGHEEIFSRSFFWACACCLLLLPTLNARALLSPVMPAHPRASTIPC